MKSALFFKKNPNHTPRATLALAIIFFCISICIILFGISVLSVQLKQIVALYRVQSKIASAQKYSKQTGQDQTKTLESEKVALNKTRQKLLKRLEQKNPLIVQQYFSIQNILPNSCTITEAKVSKRELSLQIQAPTKDTLLHYHTVLVKMPQFSSVKLSSLEQGASHAHATIKITVS
jgi:Tfp pilus assembly protein PilN